MRKLITISIFSCLLFIAKSQNHVIGTGFGISDFEPPLYINYQFNYKLLNTKLKASLLPVGLWTSPLSSSYDLYVGIKSKEEKRNIFYLNTGISFFNPKISKYETRIKQQVNPIINFGYAFAFNTNNRITADLSISQYSTYIPYKSGKNDNISVAYIIIEIGYAYKFKKHSIENITKEH